MPTIFTVDLVSWALLQGDFIILDFHSVNKSRLCAFVLYYIHKQGFYAVWIVGIFMQATTWPLNNTCEWFF